MEIITKNPGKLLISLLIPVILCCSTPAYGQATAAVSNSPTISTPVTENYIKSIAQNTAFAAFNYDYTNYQQRLSQLSLNFTKEGWQTFSKALTESNNLAVMQQNKLTVTGQLSGISKIIFHNDQNNSNRWVVEVPMQVIYSSPDNKKLTHNIIVHVGVVSVDRNINPNGLAVTQFVAKPDVSKSP